MQITDKLTQRAQEAGVSIDAVKARAGIDRTTWRRWELGEFKPRWESLEKIDAAIAAEAAAKAG